MNRSSCRVGKRGTTFGFFADATVPLQAIWSVIHTGLPPAARTILRVTSPTTLMSRFGRSECSPGGYAIGKMSAPVMSKAGRYGVSCATVLRGAWMITSGWFGSSAFSCLAARTSPSGRIQLLPAERVARLVDALVGAEPGVILQRRRDRREHLLAGRRLLARRARRQVGQLAEVQPAQEPGAAAASSCARSAAICSSSCPAPQLPRPVRMKVAPASASSFSPSLPLGVLPPSGGPFESPSGKTFAPPIRSAPVGPSIVTRLTAEALQVRRKSGGAPQRRRPSASR